MNPTKQPKTPKREMKTPSRSCSSERLRDPVQVYCRLRPLKDNCESICIKLVSPTVLALITPAESKVLRKESHYMFQNVFTSYATQGEIFKTVAFPLIEDLLKGKNGLLFTYGITGSGKTFTLTGEQDSPGIIPKCIDTIFSTISDFQAAKFIFKPDKMNGFEVQSQDEAHKCRQLEVRHNLKSFKERKGSGEAKFLYKNEGIKIQNINETNLYSVFITYIEIYNNSVYDLLDESSGKTLQSKILREDLNKNMYVHGVVEVEVKSSEEAYELFNFGQRRKRMAHTLLNSESSRSHSIFNIRVVQSSEDNQLKISQLSLVDLAGSERCNRSQTTGARLREASSINNSLMTLRTCMEILRDNQKNGANRIVPYRDSRLTHLFKNYFEGEGRIRMIVCVNPSIQDFEENLQVMKFAEMTQEVQVTRPESRYTPYRVQQKKKPPHTPGTTLKKANLFNSIPKIPSVKLNLENLSENAELIQRLMRALKARHEKVKTFERECHVKERSFRKRLNEEHGQNLLMQSEFQSLKTMLKKEKSKEKALVNQLSEVEADKENLIVEKERLQEVIQSLQQTINEKNLKLNQTALDKQKVKQKMALQEEKMSKELEAKLKRQRDHHEAAMCEQNKKIKKAFEVLSSDSPLCPRLESNNYVGFDTNNKVDQKQQTEPATESMHRRAPVVTTTRNRRSRSADEVWLEHNSIKPIPLGTVLQPSVKKRKSLTKLKKASDITNPKQSKYCLIAQDADADGDVETRVYKADIVPTCGGGAQVIFNDVERLRQESPTATPKH